MKKWMIYATLSLIIVFAAVVSGCSSDKSATGNSGTAGNATDSATPNEGKTTEITWWVPNWDEAIAKELVDEFQNKNPNIKVKIVITTWDTMANKIKVALTGNDAPEVITELESRIKEEASHDLLTKLDDYYSKGLDKNDFIVSAIDINTYNGGMYGVPFRHDGSGVLYNKQMFKDANLDPENFPKTWDELMAAAKKLTIDKNSDGTIDQYGMAWQLGNEGNAITRYAQILYTLGGNFFDDSGKKALLNTPEAVKAMNMLTSTMKEGRASKSSMELDNTKLRDLFINKKVAIYISGPFDIEPIKKSKANIDLGTAVIPGPDGMATTTVDGFSMIIPKTAKNKDAGWKLAEFIAQPQNMAKLTATFPGRKSALSEDKFSDPLLKPFSDQLEKGQSLPTNPHWIDVQKVLYRYLQLIVLNNEDIKLSMDKANAEIDAILQK